MARKFFIDDDGEAVSAKPSFRKKELKHIHVPRRPYVEFGNLELLAAARKPGAELALDVESYPNYFLIAFKCPQTQKVVLFEDSPESTIDIDKLLWVMNNFKTYGFNTLGYDLGVIYLAVQGMGAAELYEATKLIIEEKNEFGENIVNKFNMGEMLGVYIPKLNHFDLLDPCPLTGSLKKYAGRLHCERMQDLPYAPGSMLSREQAIDVRYYCVNDLDNTILVRNELKDQFLLRADLSERYEQDLWSKSDAQIAEAVMRKEIFRVTGCQVKKHIVPPGTSFKYEPPDYLNYQTQMMRDRLEVVKRMYFEVTAKGSVTMPEELKALDICIGDTIYRMGKGGLHSQEKTVSYKAENGMLLIDRDVESFYPRLILNSGMYPENMGPIFLQIFEEIVNRRIAAKRSGNTIEADSLKITINGTFGKLGSKYSVMYAPNLLIQVTLTGQLLLLMLIEAMELAGIKVVSANTDGIVMYCHESQYELLNSIVEEWGKRCNLKTEETQYAALYSRDINNYIAVKKGFDKESGKWTNEIVGTKGKGAYSNPWNDKKTAIFRFHKNPQTTICIEAATAAIVNGTPIEQTIKACTDIKKMVAVRDVKGGAEKDSFYLGKTIRWYYAKGMKGTINYVLNGNLVPNSEGAKPCMDLPPSFPTDIDYDWYINATTEILQDVGFLPVSRMHSLFD